MVGSNLVSYRRQASGNNYTQGRGGCNITHITLHHCANGNNRFPIESLGELWANPNRAGSSHYGVGTDGRIGQYVSESDRAWTDGNWDSNCHAVTIEIENCSGAPEWKISDNALKSVIKLCADIAIRNNLGPLVRGQNLGWHKLYSNVTTCPEQYVMSKIDYIIEEANKLIKPIEYEKIDRVTMYINKENASLWDLSFTEWGNAKSVMTYEKGTKIENLVAKYHHPLGGEYLLTEYSINNGKHNGFNIKDLDISLPEPIVEPEPIEPEEPKEEVIIDEDKVSRNPLVWLISIIIKFFIKLFGKGDK